jgi:histidinol-phosphate aminotransferase
LRTFSKAFGIAGIRAGFMVSNHSIMSYIKRVAQPFSIDAISQRLVASALQNWNYFKGRVNYVLKERKWLFQALTKIDGVFPYPSEANFILFKITKEGLSSSIVEQKLQKKNVIVKDRGTFPLLWNCLRVTVGSHDMNKAFISALKEALEE